MSTHFTVLAYHPGMSEEPLPPAAPPTQVNWLLSYEGYAYLVMLCCLALAGTVFYLAHIFDPRVPAGTSYGLREPIAKHMLGVYGPLVATTAMAYRDCIWGATKRTGLHKPALVYLLTVIGLGVVFGCVFLIAKGMDDDRAKAYIGSAGGMWGFTLGWIYSRLFKPEVAKPTP